MNAKLKKKLMQIAEERILSEDPSHDFSHSKRVLANAIRIARKEKGDLDVIIPACLFHDLVNYPKDHPKAKDSALESAHQTAIILKDLGYSMEQIKQVHYCIRSCSFSKGIVPHTLEAKILQDADMLEATGAISIMRTFASTGQMKRPFYNEKDPFCRKRKPEALKFAVDLFFERLLKVKARMHTRTAKQIALQRTLFLKRFLNQLKREIGN